MDSALKAKILAKLERIKKYEHDSPVDVAVMAKTLAGEYKELGDLYLQATDSKNAVNAFKKAEESDLKFVKSEFSYDKAFMERTLKERKRYWDGLLGKLDKAK